jgi:hypothetical protein
VSHNLYLLNGANKIGCRMQNFNGNVQLEFLRYEKFILKRELNSISKEKYFPMNENAEN